MQNIETLMNRAIADRNDWNLTNTRVEYEQGNDVSRVYLYGHKIAEVGAGFIQLFDGGHQSKTTKSRLNAILSENGFGDEKVYQKDSQWYIEHDGITEQFVSGMTLR